MSRARMIVLASMLALAVLSWGAASASASVTASVGANGVVDVVGDNNPNSIQFDDGEMPPDFSSTFTAEVDSLDGQAITVGTGCQELDANPDKVTCGTNTTNPAIDIQMGNANDSVVFNTSVNLGLAWFSSVTIDGGGGNDTIDLRQLDALTSGTTVTVDGGNGNDTIYGAREATNTLDGGAGNDTITGGSGNLAINTIDGGDGNDTLYGGNGAAKDTITGDAGNDTIIGQGGQDDTLIGGPGNDILNANQSNSGNLGHGDVTIDAVDGQQDTVSCDPLGTTIANVDQFDVINKSNCAQVNVTDVCAAGESGTYPHCGGSSATCPSGDTGTPPNCTSAGKTTISLALPGHQSPIRKRVLLATVKCSAACYARADAQIKAGKAKPLKLTSAVYHLTKAGSRQIQIRLSVKQSRTLRTALKEHKKIVATIVALLTDAGGKATIAKTKARTVKIKS